MKHTRSEKAIIAVLSILILCINCRSIFSLFGPVTGVDDIGYWGTGYYLAFGKVKECLSTLSYYAYGYSVFLAPLIRFVSSGELLFKGVVILNSIFILISFYLSIFVTEKMFKGISRNVLVIACFISSVYVGNVFYSSFMLAESLLMMMCWCVWAQCVSLINKYSFNKIVVTGMLLVMLHCIHQRTIAIIIPTFLFLVYLIYINNEKVKKYFIFSCCFVLAFIVSSVIKNEFIDIIFQNGAEVSLNDYSGNVSKLSNLLTIDGIFIFIRDLFSKLFCLNYSTLSVGGIGLCFWGFEAYKMIRAKKCKEMHLVYLLIVVSFLCAICVNVIFFHNTINRFEVAVYGRYIEYLYGILIIGGLLAIYKAHAKMRAFICISLAVVWIGGNGVYHIIHEHLFTSGNGLWLAPAFFRTYLNSEDIGLTTFFCIKIIMLLGVGIIVLMLIKNKLVRFLLMCSLLIYFWGWNLKALDDDYLFYQNKFREECRELCITISNLEEDVYYDAEDCDGNRINEMQFMCNKIQFRRRDVGNINDVTCDNPILINKNGEIAETYNKDLFLIIFENEKWILIERK